MSTKSSKLLAVSAVVLGVLASSGSAALNAEPVTIRARKVAAGPKIDGDLSDAVWKVATRLDQGFYVPDGGQAKAQTKVRLLYDNTSLYVAFECDEPNPTGMKTPAEDRKGFWKRRERNDLVDVFLVPAADHHYQFAVTPKGVKFDQYKGPKKDLSYKYGEQCPVGIKIGAKSWSCEMQLPFAALQIAPQMGMAWRINFTRVRSQTKEDSSWAPLSDWRDSTKFGYLKGLIIEPLTAAESPLFTLQGVDLGEPTIGAENALKLTVESHAQTQDVKIQTTFVAPDGSRSDVSSVVAFKRRERKNIEVKHQLALQPGKHTLAVSLIDPKTNKVHYSSPPATISVALSSTFYPDRFYYTREKVARIISAEDISRQPFEHVNIIGELRDKSGKRLRTGKRVKGKAGRTLFQFDITRLKPGDYPLVVTIQDKQGSTLQQKQFTLKKRAPAPREVKIDRERLCFLVDGEPFFPIRFAVNFGSQGILSDHAGEMIDAGLNTMMTFMYDLVGWEKMADTVPLSEFIQSIRDQLDIYHQAGTMLFFDIGTSVPRRHLWGKPDRRDIMNGKKPNHPALQKILVDSRAIIAAIKEHPALFSYRGMDEMSDKGFWITQAVKLNAARWEIDPCHPMHVIGPGGAALGAAEAFGTNPGMFDRGSHGPTLIPVDSRTATQVAQAREKGKAICMVVQFMASVYQRPSMSPAELRLATYLELIHGTKGIGYYASDNAYLTATKPIWDTFIALFREMKQLSPVLLSESPPQQLETNDPALHLLLKEHRGKLYMLAANKTKTELSVSFDVSSLRPDSTVKVLFEKRKLKTAGTQFRDTLAGYATRVYRARPAADAGARKKHLLKITAKRGQTEIDVDAPYVQNPGATYNSWGNLIGVLGAGNTLESIARDIDDPAIFSYDPKTRTARSTASLYVNYKAELTIGRENDPAFKETLKLDAGAIQVWAGKLRIYNSAIAFKKGKNSMISKWVNSELIARNADISGLFDIRVSKGGKIFLHGCTLHDSHYGVFSATSIVGCKFENNATLTYLYPTTFVDCEITNTGMYPNCKITYLNTTDHMLKKRYFTTGHLTVKWYLDVEVVDDKGQGVPGTEVLLSGKNGAEDLRGKTDGTGKCRLEPTQCVIDKAGRRSFQYDIKIATAKGKYEVLSEDWTPIASEKMRHTLGKK